MGKGNQTTEADEYSREVFNYQPTEQSTQDIEDDESSEEDPPKKKAKVGRGGARAKAGRPS